MKVAVVCGGVSPEREVSQNSGAAIAKALEQAGHTVVMEDVRTPRAFLEKWPTLGADGVMVALHGGWGEDGRFQACLDAFGIPYTGSGPTACAFAMDKNASKLIFEANGVRGPEGFVARRGEAYGAQLNELLSIYGKLVVKPNGGGSSTRITIASAPETLAKGIEKAWEEDERALVEAYIPGSEITVAVWEREGGETEALPVIEIRPKEGFYDYEHKYTAGYTEYLCPAPMSEALTEKIKTLAVAAHKSLGCRGYSRVDFRVTPEDDVYALEVNTAPGMTATSLVPKAAAAAGMPFAQFLEKLMRVSFAIERKF